MSTIECLEQYILLITQFIAGDITASQFEVLYLEMFKNESRELPEDIYNILNGLFSDVDAYCGDSELRDDDDLGDEELLSSARNALKELS